MCLNMVNFVGFFILLKILHLVLPTKILYWNFLPKTSKSYLWSPMATDPEPSAFYIQVDHYIERVNQCKTKEQ